MSFVFSVLFSKIMEGGLLKRYVKDNKERMLCGEKFDRGRQVEKQMYICRQRECSPLQEIETKVMALCRYQLMEAMGGGTGVIVLMWGCVRVEQFYSVNTKVQ